MDILCTSPYMDGKMVLLSNGDGTGEVREESSYFCRGKTKVVYSGKLASCMEYYNEVITP